MRLFLGSSLPPAGSEKKGGRGGGGGREDLRGKRAAAQDEGGDVASSSFAGSDGNNPLFSFLYPAGLKGGADRLKKGELSCFRKSRAGEIQCCHQILLSTVHASWLRRRKMKMKRNELSFLHFPVSPRAAVFD